MRCKASCNCASAATTCWISMHKQNMKEVVKEVQNTSYLRQIHNENKKVSVAFRHNLLEGRETGKD